MVHIIPTYLEKLEIKKEQDIYEATCEGDV